MYADTKKSEQASKSAEKQEKAHEGHGKYLGDGRFVLLCDEPNCPLASDMNFGKEQCVFHFAATHRQKEHVKSPNSTNGSACSTVNVLSFSKRSIASANATGTIRFPLKTIRISFAPLITFRRFAVSMP